MARNHFGRRDDGTSEMSPKTLDDWTRNGCCVEHCHPMTPLRATAELRRCSRRRARKRAPRPRCGRRRRSWQWRPQPAHAVAVVPRRRMKAKVATAASAGLLALSGMTAAGALPSAAQQHISTVLAKVGVSVPNGDGGHGRPGSGVHAPTNENDNGGKGTTTNHGDCVSAVAGSGGAQVSQVARSDCGKPSNAGGPADATRARCRRARSSRTTRRTRPTRRNRLSRTRAGPTGTATTATRATVKAKPRPRPASRPTRSAPQAHEPSPPAKSSPPSRPNGNGQ